jgi:hypothetical protein
MFKVQLSPQLQLPYGGYVTGTHLLWISCRSHASGLLMLCSVTRSLLLNTSWSSVPLDCDDSREGSVPVVGTLVHVCRRWRNLSFASPGLSELAYQLQQHNFIHEDVAGYLAPLPHRDTFRAPVA